MPNWCSNFVTFSSKGGEVPDISELFKGEAEGQVPDFVTDPDGYLFERVWDSPNLQFESKWTPPIKVIQQIADHFELDFVLEYDEPGNGVYGQYTYKDKILTDICLDEDDFAQFEWQEDTEMYRFEDADWESDSEIKELLLTRKIQQHGST